MVSDPLTMPIGALARPVEPLRPEDSIRLAAEYLRGSTVSALPVVDGGRLVGAVSEERIARALASGVSQEDPVTMAMDTGTTGIPAGASGAEALRRFAESGGEPVFVVDASGHVLGAVCPSDLFPRNTLPIRPSMVGGMATPFGVYLTTGTVRAGPGDLALVLTGALLFAMAAVAALGAEFALRWFRLDYQLAATLLDVVSIAIFLVLMRLAPLSGTHAAEHKVVHAIERGEPLHPTIVKRMSRVHPRCGTNFAVGVALFLGLGSATIVPYREIQLLLALVATMALWRPLGSIVQLLVTTRPPNDRQIEAGIRSGTELLERYAQDRHGPAPLWKRLWFSGLPHVIAGSTLSYLAISFVLGLFGIHVAV